MKTDNELIAEFMGHKPEVATNHPFDFNYDESWDCLMPVVEKISKFVYEEYEEDNGLEKRIIKDRAYPRTFGMISNEDGKFLFRFNRMPLHESESLIEAAYQAVIDFIKWHNKQ